MERSGSASKYGCLVDLNGPLKSKRYYRERVVYMRQLAKDALTESLRKACLRAAEEYERLAEQVDESEVTYEE